jgi:hypothetical protein
MRDGPEVVLSETGGLQPLECSIRLPHHSRDPIRVLHCARDE